MVMNEDTDGGDVCLRFLHNGYTLVLCDPHLSKPWIHSAHLAQGRALPEVRANPPLHRHTLYSANTCA